MDRVIEIPYKPRPLQLQLHKSLKRFNVVVCHRRFGKTVFAINEIVKKASLCNQPRPRYAYLAPLLKQAKQVAWDYLKHFTAPIPGASWNEAELRCDFAERRIQLLGADNPDALRGIYLDGVILDEYAQMSRRVYDEIIRPSLADRRGWAVFMGTPRGKNHFHEIFQFAQDNPADWHSVVYRASETKVIPMEELDLARGSMSKEAYAQEFECSWESALVGTFYGDYLAQAQADGRITVVPYDPGMPVHTFWDLGLDDQTAIWFMQESRKHDGYNFIDYEEGREVGLGQYIKLLRDKPYIYGTHHWPQDGRNRELTTSEPRDRWAARHGLKVSIVPIRHSERGWLAECIEATRRVLPRCRFDERKCELGLQALRSYRKAWNEDRGTYEEKPVHDWASHGTTAFHLVAMGYQGPPPTQFQTRAETDFNPFNDLHQPAQFQAVAEV